VWRGLAPRRIQRLPPGFGLYTSPATKISASRWVAGI